MPLQGTVDAAIEGLCSTIFNAGVPIWECPPMGNFRVLGENGMTDWQAQNVGDAGIIISLE